MCPSSYVCVCRKAGGPNIPTTFISLFLYRRLAVRVRFVNIYHFHYYYFIIHITISLIVSIKKPLLPANTFPPYGELPIFKQDDQCLLI